MTLINFVDPSIKELFGLGGDPGDVHAVIDELVDEPLGLDEAERAGALTSTDARHLYAPRKKYH